MNNGKVRIYELSKELNLDNRDILAVCEQLNISVKSHSSTITETEAERIRSAAEKYTPSHPPVSKPISPHSGTHSTTRESGNQPLTKKQQILEIRKPKVVPNAPTPPIAPPSNGSASTPSAPTRPVPVANSGSAPVRPTNLNRPAARPGLNGEESSPQRPARLDEENEVSAIAPAEMESPETSFYEAVEVVVSPEAKPSMGRKPELVNPPARPSAPGVDGARTLVNRPVLKTARTSDRPESRADNDRPEANRSEGGTVAPPVKPSLRKPGQPAPGGTEGGDRPRRQPTEGGNARPPANRPSAPLELRRPQLNRPAMSAADASATGDEPTKNRLTEVVPEVEDPALLLRRPAPPKPPKRGKGWEEEEEEITEIPKATKLGTKGKRRNQPLLEDDFEEELIDELNIPEPTVQVSLSLARPARPKSRTAQAKPTTAPITPASAKNKKPSGRGDRRERRAEEAKPERPETITLTGSLTVQELASILAVPETELIKMLFFKGIAANINQTLDASTATTLAQELGVTVETAEKESAARKVTEMLDAADLGSLQPRPPVVTIMGHVDHGKTTLLDSIRKTKVAQGEAGGITQHIGAYHVDVEHNGETQQVVFLDTPGHEAFTAMRARGTRVTDIAVLVVAADDGVQPQTIEAISHAKAAEVPIVVAINKIDKEGAQPDRVKQELTEFDLVPEEWGGETIMVPVSAMTGENLDTLLEMLLLVAEVEDLYANPDRAAKGTIIEAHLDKARGPVASLLVQNGTLRVGDIIVAGSSLGKVRAMVDDRGKRVDAASPSFAVQVLGLSDVPAAGDEFEVFQDEREARAVASERADEQRLSRLQQRAMAARQVSLNSLSARAQEGELKELNLIVKADVQGSVEAILSSLQQLPQNEVQVRVLLSAPGEVTETDVDLAAASDAVILGFNTTLASGSRQAADRLGVDIREYNIIYKLLDDIQAAMEGLLEPELVEEALGQVEVRAVFPVGRGSVAGCYVLSGKIIRNSNVRVRRNSAVIHEGILDSLKRMKEDAKEVNAGYECGIGLNSFNDWVEGDIIEVFRMVTKRRTLSAS